MHHSPYAPLPRRRICRGLIRRPAGNVSNIHGIDNILEAIRQVFARSTTTVPFPTHASRLRARRWRSRLPCSRCCAATWRERGDVHPGHGIRLPGRGVHYRCLRSGEMIVRAQSIRTSSTSTSRCWIRAGRRSCGAPWARSWKNAVRKLGRGGPLDARGGSEPGRARAILAHRPRSAGARALCACHSSGITGGRWISSGPRTAPTASCYILQARPETVKSRKRDVEQRYALKGSSRVLASGRAIGHKIGSGAVRVVPDASQMAKVKQGDVLVTDMTDPNWEPVMKLAAAIVTNRGGRTCHAAIIARELRHPRGRRLRRCHRAAEGRPAGDGFLRRGRHRQRVRRAAAFEDLEPRAREMPAIPVKIAMNVAIRIWRSNSRSCPTPASAWRASNSSSTTRSACTAAPASSTADLPAPLKKKLAEKAAATPIRRAFFREKMVEGVATIAAAFWPKPVIVRLSDFKSTSTRSCSAASATSPTRKTRCSASAALRATSRPASASASSWNARR